jgi:hypothetical protein
MRLENLVARRPKWLFTVTIPAAWATTCFAGFHFPGDEYGLWAAASLPGLWLVFLIPVNDVNVALWMILAAGSVVMAALGAVLDRLRSSFIVWYALWTVSAGMLCWLMLRDFPSWQRAMSKNGSFQAYALSAMNVGLLLSTIVVLAGTSLIRLNSRVRGWVEGTDKE